MNSFNANEHVAAYLELRAASKNMHVKLFDVASNNFDPLKIAKRLGVPTPGRTIIFDDEVLQDAFLDFMFHEYRVGGRTMVETCAPVAGQFTPLEVEILQALCSASTSLFKVRDAFPERKQILLHDLLNPDRPEVTLTDIGLSGSAQRDRALLFTRVVSLRGISMTTGVNFPFYSEDGAGLLQAYRQKMKKVSPEKAGEERFIFFFHKYQVCGAETRLQDVV